MNITLVSVGKLKNGPEKQLVDDYVSRIRKTGPLVGIRSFRLIEVVSGGGVKAESRRLRDKIPGGARIVRLDEAGGQYGSTALASQLGKLNDQGVGHLCFLIAGAQGYDPDLCVQFPCSLALGPQTWPHRLVRVMVCEQIYRAVCLLVGFPYHNP